MGWGGDWSRNLSFRPHSPWRRRREERGGRRIKRKPPRTHCRLRRAQLVWSIGVSLFACALQSICCVYVCLCVCVSVCLSVCPSVYVSVLPSIVSVCLPAYLFVCLSVYPSLPIHSSIVSVCLPVHPSVCLSVCLSVRQPIQICPSIHPLCVYSVCTHCSLCTCVLLQRSSSLWWALKRINLSPLISPASSC